MFKIVTLLMVGAVAAAAAEPKADNGVYLLDPNSFTDFVLNNPETIVLFHETKCTYCEEVKETFRRLLEKNKAKYPDLKAAIVDGESDETFKESNDVVRCPQMRLYVNKGFFAFYEEDLNDEGLQHFLDFHLPTKNEPVLVDSDRTYVRYNNRQNSIMLAFKSVGDDEKEFAFGLQKVVPDIPVYYMKSSSKYAYMVYPEDSSKSSFKMKMKRNFDEGDKFLGTREMFEPRHILKIVWPYRRNKIEIFTERHINQTLRSRKTAIYFFDDDYNSDASESFAKAILSQNLDALAIKSNLKEQGSERLMNIFGVQPEDFPTVRIAAIIDKRLQKFKLEEAVSEMSVTDFLKKFAANELKEYKKSQKVFDNSGKAVLQLNREQLNEQVHDSKTHLVIGFVGKTGAVVQEMFEKAVPSLRNKSQFTLATVDVNRNDIDGLSKDKIPLIQILTKSQRKRPLTYDGEETPEALAAYLNENIDGTDEL